MLSWKPLPDPIGRRKAKEVKLIGAIPATLEKTVLFAAKLVEDYVGFKPGLIEANNM